MASIIHLAGRKLPWRAEVRRKGHPKLAKHFPNKKEAQHWADEQERSIRLAGLPLTIEALKKETVGGLIDRYLLEKTPLKGCVESEKTVLKAFRRRPLAVKAFGLLSKKDGYEYVNARLGETFVPRGAAIGRPITPRTVRREINSIQHVFSVAREEWGFPNLVNPFEGIRIKGSQHRRTRRLREGELRKLEEACRECRGLNLIYVPLAMYLAIETGMRLQEIFNLKWRDVDFEKRTIDVRKGKTGARTIVLTKMAALYLKPPVHASKEMNEELIFPMTKMAFKQVWHDVVRRAGISDLTFHDLRREAGSRFDEAGLTKGQHDLMMGHANRDMASIYIFAELKAIRDKLDRYSG